jgi:DNA invertase Pin-like site-specific DNA recombinase
MRRSAHPGPARAPGDPVGDQLGEPSAKRTAAGRRLLVESSPNRIAMLGYASISAPGDCVKSKELKEQAEVIARQCERRGLTFLELVSERATRKGKTFERPGLSYALKRISSCEAQGLVVAELSRLTDSVAELREILEWFIRSEARFVAVAQAIDTGDRDGRLAAEALVRSQGWEREWLSQRTPEWRGSRTRATASYRRHRHA